MITISFVGGDKYFVAERISCVHNEIANLYETEAENIEFLAFDSFIIHRGIEQSSYRLNVYVDAPKNAIKVENTVSDFILHEFSSLAVHVTINFRYYETNHYHELVLEGYPAYLTNKIEVKIEDDEILDDKIDIADEDIYTGNVFADFDKLVEKKK